VIVLRQADLDAILGHARAAAPEEACGILGGRDEGEARTVEALHPCRNVAPEPRWEYRADPRDQLRAFLAVEEAGLEVVGFYHSHPQGPAQPSPVDAARASYPGASYVLVWLAPEAGWGSWRWAPPRGFAQERAVVAQRA
jgi:proteasome lid subunit RPN8/RPN11